MSNGYTGYPKYSSYPSHQAYPNYQAGCPNIGALTDLYPETYRVIYPVVEREIFNLRISYGPTYMPTREVYEQIVDRCYREVEPYVYDILRKGPAKVKQQQFFDDDSRDLLRAFIGATLVTGLLRSFIGPFGFGGFGPLGFGGFGGPFGGFF